MKYPIISKENLPFTPNLQDYDRTYKDFSWDKAKEEIVYFDDGTVNIAHNALDKHKGTDIEKKTALIWEDDETSRTFTFGDLIAETNKFANVLKKLGVVKGDRVFMFLPRIPELYTSFLGTLKTGAIAGNLFAAFGYEALEDRLSDSEAKILVTTHELEERVNKIKKNLPHLEHIILVDTEDVKHEEVSYATEMKEASDQFEVAHMKEDEPSYMLYTSGTTGKPKGVIHTHGGIVQEHLTGKWILDMQPDDIYWCTADPGWVTGVVYGTISPWSNGLTQIIHGGRFDPDRWYELIEKHKVTIWYTAPTAIRMLMIDSEMIKKHDLSSLRYISSVGEPLNPEAIVWGQKHLKLPIHDNYWQTETGSIVIANYPSMDIKPGSMGKPFPGMIASILDEDCKELGPGQEGDLAFKKGWPSMMKGIWKNEKKYNSFYKGDWYLTGDKAFVDEDGYYWFIGRDDDIIKTAGERVGPFEVESALIAHPAIVEAGVIGKPDEIRGQIIKAFIKLKPGQKASDELKEDIQKFVKKELAGHAYPREIEFRDKLPKTRSGKIMRRVLKLEELGEDLGDTSTMEEY